MRHCCQLLFERSIIALLFAQASVLQVQHDEVPRAVQQILEEFQSVSHPKDRYKLLLSYAKKLSALDASQKVATNRVMGCTSQVFMTASLDKQNRVQFAGDSDSELTRGLCAVLIQGMSGLTPAEVLQVRFRLMLDILLVTDQYHCLVSDDYSHVQLSSTWSWYIAFGGIYSTVLCCCLCSVSFF